MILPGLHVAIIMDGNGRWAARRSLPRAAGHRAGIEAVRRVVESAPGLGVGTLTLYAFSSDNWRRPPDEVGHLMGLLQHYLEAESRRCVANGVRVTALGRRDRLPATVAQAIGATEAATADGRRLHLRIAVDYSSRDAILAAARRIEPLALERETLATRLGDGLAGDVDLLIRTGGEQRLSDFLLWESAYAELLFVETPWPEFGARELAGAVAEFQRRQRRFGGLSKASSG
jgi:undecaprenyl diphosphate synthase